MGPPVSQPLVTTFPQPLALSCSSSISPLLSLSLSLCLRRTACSCSLRSSVLPLAIPRLHFRRGWTITPGRWWSSRRSSPAPSRRRVSSPRLGFVLPTSSFPQPLHWSGASTTPHGSSFSSPSGLGIYTSASAICQFPSQIRGYNFFFQFLMCTFWAPGRCWVGSCLGIWKNTHALLKKSFFSPRPFLLF